ncbi:MAG: hypothetical protein US45_C0009G0002 [Candidatus Nomurabacteria bacterium GW2011_GWA1_37_20]|uniref:Uncharacterized protein n=1 Tax=Candidatus Nomurabacteria bacterium GW2011_GWA1_37_20 TaxID=1618729 RepID=A0A0G0GUF4_9BACT|nr:MAG: hypothetical protein US33_C0023G0002 [Parcubacteria group bacterium GW2011_GWC1_36_9]KKQ27483.1 MAG: hypothetical protein US41_C0017G0002 [Parcubacteria group bacterium GW2011_GWB1_37_13]KKQ33692.1 MAG: hypothetical protein US45_C0009G0002 [Candidatus Nomurabacteria bacterium GW2011_GWA1_37_20]KKT94855.1 MAG: hypothetical protein UW97_C0032G0002 [Parcubacteria group bacterium GW2011_GWA2_45_15]
MKYNKGFVNIILVVVIVAIVAVGGYFVLNKKTQESNINQISNTTTPIPKDWTTYTHSTGLYSLSYPSDWGIEAGSTKTSLRVGTNVIDVRIDLDNQQLNFIQTSAKAQNTSMVQKKWKSVGGYQIDEITFYPNTYYVLPPMYLMKLGKNNNGTEVSLVIGISMLQYQWTQYQSTVEGIIDSLSINKDKIKTLIPTSVQPNTYPQDDNRNKFNENTSPLTTEELQTRDRNAKIVVDMSHLLTTAELIFSSNNGYATFCSNGLMNINAKPLTDLPVIVQEIISAQQVSSQSQAGITCISSQSKYVLQIIFTKSIAGYPQSFCIDSLGHMGDDRKFKLNSTTLSCQKITS